jgi:alkylation response protein AidB-like acyl-CoA dehydrogenase
VNDVWAWDALESEERRALCESVRGAAEGVWGLRERADGSETARAQLRERLDAIGVSGLLVTETQGGVGGDLADAAALATEIGRLQLPFSTAELVLGESQPPSAAAMLDLFEMSGAISGLLANTARYLGQRVQFGRPLLELQVLQHRLADLSLRQHFVETAALGALRWLASPSSDGAVAPESVHRLACATYQDAIEDALQLHGAIGFTWEAGFHRYFEHVMRTAERSAG